MAKRGEEQRERERKKERWNERRESKRRKMKIWNVKIVWSALRLIVRLVFRLSCCYASLSCALRSAVCGLRCVSESRFGEKTEVDWNAQSASVSLCSHALHFGSFVHEFSPPSCSGTIVLPRRRQRLTTRNFASRSAVPSVVLAVHFHLWFSDAFACGAKNSTEMKHHSPTCLWRTCARKLPFWCGNNCASSPPARGNTLSESEVDSLSFFCWTKVQRRRTEKT